MALKARSVANKEVEKLRGKNARRKCKKSRRNSMDVSPCIKARNERENLNQMLLEVEQAKEQLSQACVFNGATSSAFVLALSLKCETKKIKKKADL